MNEEKTNHESYLESQISFLRKAINERIITKDSTLLQEQKELIIDQIASMIKMSGYPINKSEIGAFVDKQFTEQLGIV